MCYRVQDSMSTHASELAARGFHVHDFGRERQAKAGHSGNGVQEGTEYGNSEHVPRAGTVENVSASGLLPGLPGEMSLDVHAQDASWILTQLPIWGPFR